MRFMVSLIGDESFIEEATPERVEEIIMEGTPDFPSVAEMGRFNDELEEAGVAVQGNGLGPSASAKTLRYGKDGKPVVTDGPFTESKEQIGGYWIFECEDIDEAVEWVRRSPIREGAVEIRQIAGSAEENVELYKQQSRA
jgi:hypothetical protein